MREEKKSGSNLDGAMGLKKKQRERELCSRYVDGSICKFLAVNTGQIHVGNGFRLLISLPLFLVSCSRLQVFELEKHFLASSTKDLE